MANIGEIQIRGDQHPVLCLANLRDAIVRCAGQFLIINGHGIVTGVAQNFTAFFRKILIDLELHAAAGSSGTISSCANSAA